MKTKIILSNENETIVSNLEKFGFQPVFCEKVSEFLPFEQNHIDMKCVKIKDTFFVLKNCKDLIETLKSQGLNVIATEKKPCEKYPLNVLLNCLYLNNKLYCKIDSIDNKVKEFCQNNKIEIINVNQGYTKCSTAVIKDKFITADKGIFKALTENGVEGLLIEAGDIELKGVDYGFIGGCCFYKDDTVYFTGDIRKHGNYKEIESFCHNNKVNIVCLTNEKLQDIGGFVVI